MFIAENLNQALLITGRALLEKGVWRETRGYRCLELPHPLLLCITNPTDRYCTIPERKWNKYLGWVESLWLAMGINDMKMPSHYVKNLLSFSDDGKYMRAGYGPRLRGYNGSTKDYKYSTSPAGRCGVDQLKFVIDTLQNEKTSRQACITIHDPIKDDYEWNGTEYVLKKTKDIPCTRTLQFMVVEGKLDCTVTMRSNDCFTYETKIPLLNGEVWELGRLAEEKADEKFWVYSRDDNGKIVAGLAHHPRKMRTVKTIMRVTLDNGEVIECTPEHRFMLSNGSYKEIKDIGLDESLAPLYRRFNNKGYEEVFTHGHWETTHRLAYESVKGRKTHGRKNVLHHSDFNKRNNTPENLIEMDWDDHIAFHSNLVTELNSKLWDEENPDFPLFEKQRQFILEGLKRGNEKRWNSLDMAEQKEAQSKVMSSICDYLWNSRDGFREYMKPIQSINGRKNFKKLWANPEFVKKISEISSKRLNDPDVKSYLAKITSERNKRNWTDAKYRKEMSEKLKEVWTDEKRRQAANIMMERSRKMWNDPSFVANQREKQRAKTAERWKDPIYVKEQIIKRNLSKVEQIRKILLFIDSKKIPFTEENYNEVRLGFNIKYPSIKNVIKRFGSLENAKAELIGNHKIIKKELLEKEVDVYDLTVDKYHNFALESGVFVHNCIWGMSAVNVFNFTLMQEYIAGILGLEIGNYYHFVTNFHVYEDKVDQLKEIVENNKVEDYKSKHNFQYLLPNSLIYFDVFISELARFERRFREHSIRIDIDEYLKWETPIGEFGYLWKDWALVFYKHVFPEVEIKFNNPYLNDLFSK